MANAPLSFIAGPLAWLGRQGTLAVALSAVLGICLPPLSALARPFLQEAVFALLVLAFLRVDITAIRGHLARPVLLACIVGWMMVVVPVGLGIFGRASGLIHAAPEMMLALYIVAVTPPLMSGPAFAYLLGLDGALSLAVLVLGMILTPISAPLLAPFILGSALPISALSLSLRLAGLLVGSLAVAYVLRHLLGERRLSAAREEINGLNVVLLFIFAVAVMDGVATNFAENPYLSIAVAILTMLIAVGQIVVTMLVFIGQRGANAFVIALGAGNRNMSLIIAALGASVPDFTWLFFALAQLPIYFLPLLVKPIATYLIARDAARR